MRDFTIIPFHLLSTVNSKVSPTLSADFSSNHFNALSRIQRFEANAEMPSLFFMVYVSRLGSELSIPIRGEFTLSFIKLIAKLQQSCDCHFLNVPLHLESVFG